MAPDHGHGSYESLLFYASDFVPSFDRSYTAFPSGREEISPPIVDQYSSLGRSIASTSHRSCAYRSATGSPSPNIDTRSRDRHSAFW
ncbi:hypothetical protein ZHAS_00016426 [Anopheles sinensis]|uniref:Uncharacterized protein n=1 Tax=Anopheles sinensis TaxID=74873 RepID=A0A084WE01_ANOSI|nr:hypothetical protein ZHAS_00016426 [Anopheles sinensis]